MKIFNDLLYIELPDFLQSSLIAYREKRNFNVNQYVKLKSYLINKYFTQYNLDTVVVPVSGGVDSAVVLSLFNYIKRNYLTIKNIYPVFVPAYDSVGMTDQLEVKKQAEELCKGLGYTLNVLDLSNMLAPIKNEVRNLTGIKEDSWSEGQLIPYLRTTTLYYLNTIFNQSGKRSVVIGTINADEGQYIGYIGKASDGMVDLQVLSDIHKSEVYQLAHFFNVPESIINIAPKGELYDSRTDLEMFGFSYDFLELYLNYLTLNIEEKESFINQIKLNNELEVWEYLKFNVENLHKLNSHKYLGCSPAVHFDVIEMSIDNGWNYKNWRSNNV